MLFTGTIADNLRYGKRMQSGTYQALMWPKPKTLSRAEEEGFATHLAEGGKQSIRWSEATLVDCPRSHQGSDIYIFDDSFSAGYRTDAILRRRLKSDADTVWLSRSVGAIMDADQIIVLIKGEIVQIKWRVIEKLMETNDIYRNCWVTQLKKCVSDRRIGGEGWNNNLVSSSMELFKAYRFSVFFAVFLKIVQRHYECYRAFRIRACYHRINQQSSCLANGVVGRLSIPAISQWFQFFISCVVFSMSWVPAQNYFMTNAGAVHDTGFAKWNEWKKSIVFLLSYFDKHQFGDLLGPDLQVTLKLFWMPFQQSFTYRCQCSLYHSFCYENGLSKYSVGYHCYLVDSSDLFWS